MNIRDGIGVFRAYSLYKAFKAAGVRGAFKTHSKQRVAAKLRKKKRRMKLKTAGPARKYVMRQLKELAGFKNIHRREEAIKGYRRSLVRHANVGVGGTSALNSALLAAGTPHLAPLALAPVAIGIGAAAKRGRKMRAAKRELKSAHAFNRAHAKKLKRRGIAAGVAATAATVGAASLGMREFKKRKRVREQGKTKEANLANLGSRLVGRALRAAKGGKRGKAADNIMATRAEMKSSRVAHNSKRDTVHDLQAIRGKKGVDEALHRAKETSYSLPRHRAKTPAGALKNERVQAAHKAEATRRDFQALRFRDGATRTDMPRVTVVAGPKRAPDIMRRQTMQPRATTPAAAPTTAPAPRAGAASEAVARKVRRRSRKSGGRKRATHTVDVHGNRAPIQRHTPKSGRRTTSKETHMGGNAAPWLAGGAVGAGLLGGGALVARQVLKARRQARNYKNMALAGGGAGLLAGAAMNKESSAMTKEAAHVVSKVVRRMEESARARRIMAAMAKKAKGERRFHIARYKGQAKDLTESSVKDRSRGKKLLALSAAGTLGLATGGAALAPAAAIAALGGGGAALKRYASSAGKMRAAKSYERALRRGKLNFKKPTTKDMLAAYAQAA